MMSDLLMKAQVERRSYATRWRWRWRDNPTLAIERSRIEVGRQDPYPDRFRIVQYVDGHWSRWISNHRKKQAAIAALRKVCKRL